ncbi:MAG TPA: flagellar assembly protein A [Rhodocyclaceae bacterium]|nr:flagellar assembly protein A [Rhodocyclaceae bacterium]
MDEKSRPLEANSNQVDQDMQSARFARADDTRADDIETSPVGTMSNLGEGQMLLPNFITQRSDGVYLSPALLTGPLQLLQFIDRAVATGVYFGNLDYVALSRILFPFEPAGAPVTPMSKNPVRVASDIRYFKPERRLLYKNFKITSQGSSVEYLFEPVQIERLVKSPIYGKDDLGESVITGYEETSTMEPTMLTLDEFVFSMWERRVRCGIDFKAIAAAIANTRSDNIQRIDVARRISAVKGIDATVIEVTDTLHRDDSPTILPNGKVDLRQFKNRFPQVSNGARLLKKVPRVFGKLGYEIDGRPIEPGTPRDFDLEDMSGPGTRVERGDDGEYIVATADGFLNIDTDSQIISITEKVVNRAGVSIRTTGDVALTGDNYEEMGEVQERRQVSGKNMVFHADVFGNIVSSGGRVHLLATLAGGSIKNVDGGSVQIDKRATQSMLDARGCEVKIKLAEGVSIMAAKVKIDRAVACDIVADEIEIEEAIGCALIGRKVELARAGARKHIETLVSVCVPNLSRLDASIAQSAQEVDKITQQIAARKAQMDSRMAIPEVKNYIVTDQKIRAGTLKLTFKQEEQWQQMSLKVAKPMQELRVLRSAINGLNTQLVSERENMAALLGRRTEAAAGISCKVGSVLGGDVTVRTMLVNPGDPLLPGLTTADLKLKMRDPKDMGERLFSNDKGGFAWTWQPPEQQA